MLGALEVVKLYGAVIFTLRYITGPWRRI